MALYFPQPYPARAAVGVAQLPRGARVEIECVLYLGCSRRSAASPSHEATRHPSTQAQGCARPPRWPRLGQKPRFLPETALGRAGCPDPAHHHQSSDRSRRCAASARRSPSAWRGSASRRLQDLLFVLPLRYEDRTTSSAIGALTSRDARGGRRRGPARRGRLPRPPAAAVQPLRRLRVPDAALLPFLGERSSRDSPAARACAASARCAAVR